MDLLGSDDAHITEYKDEVRTIFGKVDVDGSGVIDKSEFIEAVAKDDDVRELVTRSRLLAGLVAAGELESAFANFDKDGGGTLTFDEFWAFCKEQADEDNIRKMFAAIDADGSRYITHNELVKAFKTNQELLRIVKGSKVFGKLVEENDWGKVLSEMDTDKSGEGDGQIDFVEFWAWCKRVAAKVQANKIREVGQARTRRVQEERSVLSTELIKRLRNHTFTNGAAQGGVSTVSVAPELFNFPHLAQKPNPFETKDTRRNKWGLCG